MLLSGAFHSFFCYDMSHLNKLMWKPKFSIQFRNLAANRTYLFIDLTDLLGDVLLSKIISLHGQIIFMSIKLFSPQMCLFVKKALIFFVPNRWQLWWTFCTSWGEMWSEVLHRNVQYKCLTWPVICDLGWSCFWTHVRCWIIT